MATLLAQAMRGPKSSVVCMLCCGQWSCSLSHPGFVPPEADHQREGVYSCWLERGHEQGTDTHH